MGVESKILTCCTAKLKTPFPFLLLKYTLLELVATEENLEETQRIDNVHS